VVIEVADTGIGIPKKDIPKLFERFSDIDRQRHPQGKGSGLGLSLVKELVTLMGGEINVSSELNQGTCFSIRLPVTPPPKMVAANSQSDDGSVAIP
jgi:signal transduction histidine kinase